MKDQAEENSKPLAGGLYVVATPLGNLEDLGFRALRVLKDSAWIAAEDTRQTRKLLDHYGLTTHLRSLHEHSTEARVEDLVNDLSKGQVAAYVSDAGTPGVSDPGPALVRACVEAGIPVYPVPGPAAPVALLSVAGFRQSGFHFHGFFPRENKEREAWAKSATSMGGVQIFFESPHRISGALEFLARQWPEAPLVVGRELTKRFETITRGTCSSVSERLGKEEPRGEYVVGLELPEAAEEGPKTKEVEALVKELALLGCTQKALTKVGMSHGLRKNEAYQLALAALGKE